MARVQVLLLLVRGGNSGTTKNGRRGYRNCRCRRRRDSLPLIRFTRVIARLTQNFCSRKDA